VSLGLDANDRASVCPVVRIFIEVPPMSTTSTLLTAGRLAVSFLIEDLRVIFPPSCRIVARLRLAADEDLTVMVPANPVDWDLIMYRARGAGHHTRHGRSCVRTFICGATALIQSLSDKTPHLLLTGRTATGCSRVN